jgi:acyl-homoserine-lactone acylase
MSVGYGAIELRYTGYGVAHIKADDFEGAGFGYGIAVARDNLCLMADRTITIAGERSRRLSPDEGYVDLFAGGRISNVDSDAAYLYLLSPETLAQIKAAASPEMKALVRGYAAGFNDHAAAGNAPGEDCRRQPWFRPMTEDDVWRRIAHIPLLETTAGVLRELAAAAPPDRQSAHAAPEALEWADREAGLHGASNAIAFGREGVAGGVGGMSFANPHYVWHGAERLHAFHMTVPGKLDVFGATALGLPFPMLGFSPDVGWGITHTTDRRSTLYELTLDPDDPTRYLVDGISHAMRRVPVEVQTGGGAFGRTFWETDFGVVVEGARLPWDNKRAYVFADAQRQNTAFADQFLAIARASSVHGIKQALDGHLGSPWSNVTAADKSGEVLYANISVAANITDAQLADCLVQGPARAFMDIADVTVLDGARSACAWTLDPRSPRPGIIPAQLRPSLIRRDVVWNSNDSHWFDTLSPGAHLTGFPKVIGPEQSIRGERTRMAATLAREMIATGGASGVRGATPTRWETAFFEARNLTAELILPDLLADCAANSVVTLKSGVSVDLRKACDVLGQWDGRDTPDAIGSALFGEFLRNLDAIPMTGFALEARLWKQPFDPADPVGTPSGLQTGPETREALALAVHKFDTAKVAIDARLRDVQAVTRNGVRMPISGSSFAYHLVRPGAFEDGKGITEIRTGDSYIHAVSLLPTGPKGRFIVTYSQSTNASSPHFADMTAVYARQSLLDIPFSEGEVAAAQVGPTEYYNAGQSMRIGSPAMKRVEGDMQ